MNEPEAGVEFSMPFATQTADSPFSAEEKVEVRAALVNVKVLFRAHLPELSSGDRVILEEKLDDMGAALDLLTRDRWRALVVGTLITVALDHLVPANAVLTLLKMLGQVLPHLSLASLPALGQ